MSFYNTGNPVPSIDPRDLDDNAKHVDELVNSTFPTFTDRLGTTRKTLAGIEADADAATLRGDLAADDGDTLIGSTSGGAGAVGRTVADRLNDSVHAKNYGAVCDGTYHPLSEFFATLADAQFHYATVPVTSLAQSIDWAALQSAVNTGRVVNFYDQPVITDEIIIPEGSGLIGQGCARYVVGYGFFTGTGGSAIIAYGTGAKNHTADHISDCNTGGGVIANPSAADPYTTIAPTPTYALVDLTNQDAVGATMATLRPFSAAISSTNNGNIILRDFRVIPWYNGQLGYVGETNPGLGDEWDVGVYLYNSQNSIIENVQMVGYWRIAGCLKVGMNDVDTQFVEAETDSLYRCTFQGFTGFQVRSYDLYRVTAFTGSTIEIPWSASHRFPTTGSVRVLAVDRTYTGLGFSGDKLTFTGVSDTSGLSVGSELRFSGNNFGTSGTQLIDCYIGSLNHHTRLLSTSVDLTTPFVYPSAAIQISGEPVRAIQFIGCTIIGRDDLLVQMLRTGDANFIGCYFEGQNARDTLNGPLGDIPAGTRLLAASASNSLATYPAGSTTNLRFTACTYGPGVDKSPRYGTTAAARFVTGLGLFKPREVFDDKEAFPEHGSELRMESTGDARIQPGIGKFTYIGPSSGDADVQSSSGSLNMRSGLRMRIGSPSVNWWAADATRFAPQAAGMELGNTGATNIFGKSYVIARHWSATVFDSFGTGSPEGVVTAAVGSTFRRTNGGAVTTFYVKETGAGNTGWVAK